MNVINKPNNIKNAYRDRYEKQINNNIYDNNKKK